MALFAQVIRHYLTAQRADIPSKTTFSTWAAASALIPGSVGFTIRSMLQRFNHKNVSCHLVIRQQNKRTVLTNRTAVAYLAGTDLVDRFANILCHLYSHLSKLEI